MAVKSTRRILALTTLLLSVNDCDCRRALIEGAVSVDGVTCRPISSRCFT